MSESLAVLGRCLVDQKRYAEAEQQWRQCLAIREEKTPDHWRRFDALVQLGASLTGQMKFEQAEPLAIEGYQGLADRRKSAGDKRRTMRALRQIVELYEAWKKPAKAKPWQDKLSAAEVEPACNSPP
ncbi:MAG: tetratricopeptide repeat protein [Planctomycetes bacterium]|nr:tetratricopeptide repeat protein [Planctomycetota bacterium]